MNYMEYDIFCIFPFTVIVVTVVTFENGYSLEKEDELEHLWTILFIFFILFLFSVCYSATITLFKVSGGWEEDFLNE